MTILPRLVFVYVHVTVSPASSLIVAVWSEIVLGSAEEPSSQARLLKSQPAGSVDSVTVYVPFARPVYDCCPSPPLVVIEKDEGMSPVAAYPKVSSPPSATFLITMFAGAWIAADMIWLSRLPTAEPSVAVTRTWYGPPEMSPDPSPGPHPREPRLAARWLPNRSMTCDLSAVEGTEYVSVIEA